MEVKNFLLGYKDMYIYQDTNSFCFSLDSILLPNFVTLNSKIKRILDIGTGNAPIPLILSRKTKAKITAVEIQEHSYELATKSIAINKLDEQIELIKDDINNYQKNVESDYFDVITCNPPFFEYIEHSKVNENEQKTKARHDVNLTLEQLFKIARKLLKNNGVIAIVIRPERLVEVLTVMKEYNLEPKKLQFIYPNKEKDANILLVEGKKNGNKGIKILPPIYAHKENGDYTEEIMNYFVG